MDNQLKQSWCEALRSDKYKQGRGSLQENGQFCCLGVLADVIDPDGWFQASQKEDFFHWTHNNVNHAGYFTADFARELFGEDGDHQQCILADMNDEEHSFAEIADHIEKNL